MKMSPLKDGIEIAAGGHISSAGRLAYYVYAAQTAACTFKYASGYPHL